MKGLIPENGKLVLATDLKASEPAEGEVSVQVVSATLNPSDPDIAAGHWDDFFPERTAGQAQTGFEFSGVVASDGESFKAGDKVIGYIDVFSGGNWAHQEIITIPEACLAAMPSNASFDEAAAVPMAGETTLVALRDVGELKSGERALIIGAAGGLGVFAVQIAKVLGAQVTAVAGPGQAEFLTKLGADQVIDYKETPIAEVKDTFDVILDLSTEYFHADIAHLLSEEGRFIPSDPNKLESDFAEGTVSASQTRYLLVPKGTTPELQLLANWMESGDIVSPVDSVHELTEIEAAFERLSVRNKQGRIVLRVSNPA